MTCQRKTDHRHLAPQRKMFAGMCQPRHRLRPHLKKILGMSVLKLQGRHLSREDKGHLIRVQERLLAKPIRPNPR